MALIKCSKSTLCGIMNEDTKEKCICGSSIEEKVIKERLHMGIDENEIENLEYIYDTKHERYCINVIDNYEIVNSKKSGKSLAARAGIGFVALGPIGLIAAATAKSNVQVLLSYKNGNKDLVILNEKNIKLLMERV